MLSGIVPARDGTTTSFPDFLAQPAEPSEPAVAALALPPPEF